MESVLINSSIFASRYVTHNQYWLGNLHSPEHQKTKIRIIAAFSGHLRWSLWVLRILYPHGLWQISCQCGSGPVFWWVDDLCPFRGDAWLQPGGNHKAQHPNCFFSKVPPVALMFCFYHLQSSTSWATENLRWWDMMFHEPYNKVEPSFRPNFKLQPYLTEFDWSS